MCKKIFISHSCKDKKLVEIFVDKLLVCGMEFSANDIFCTSLEGMKIHTGEDWRNEIQKSLCKAKVVILFITPNYKESELCLNEMGAAWAMNIKVIPIIIDPLNFDSLGSLYEVKQSLKMTVESDLDELKISLDEFNPNKVLISRWNVKKVETISSIKKYISENPFDIPISRDDFNKLQKQNEELNVAFDNIVEEKDKYYNLYNKLKECKDKDLVLALEKDYGLFDEYTSFIKKAQDIGDLINNYSAPVRSIIYYKLTNQNLTLSRDNRRLYSQELKEAYSSKIIDEEENLNTEHPKIKEIVTCWAKFKDEFKNLQEQTLTHLGNEYPDIVIEPDSSDVWKEIMGVKNILF